MTNPNNCETCEYKTLKASDQTDGHCYMFREEPTDTCMQHTGRRAAANKQINDSMHKTIDLLLRSGYCGRIK